MNSEIIACMCPSCFRLKEDLRKLPCGHVMCAECVDESEFRCSLLMRVAGFRPDVKYMPVRCVACEMTCNKCDIEPFEEGIERVRHIKEEAVMKNRTCSVENCEEAATAFDAEKLFLCAEHARDLKDCTMLCTEDGKLDPRLPENYLEVKQKIENEELVRSRKIMHNVEPNIGVLDADYKHGLDDDYPDLIEKDDPAWEKLKVIFRKVIVRCNAVCFSKNKHLLNIVVNKTKRLLEEVFRIRDPTIDLLQHYKSTPLTTKGMFFIKEKDLLESVSMKTEIDCGCSMWDRGGITWDRKRRRLLINSYRLNGGSDIIFVNFDDDGNPQLPVVKKEGLVPFKTAMKPVYDGGDKCYLYADYGNHFGYIDLTNDTFKLLSGFRYFQKGCDYGFFQNGRFYIDADDSRGETRNIFYNWGSWNNYQFRAHGVCIPFPGCTCEEKFIVSDKEGLDIGSIMDFQFSYTSNYYVCQAGAFLGESLIYLEYNGKWRVYDINYNVWTELPWDKPSNSKTICYAPELGCFFFTKSGESCLLRVDVPCTQKPFGFLDILPPAL